MKPSNILLLALLGSIFAAITISIVAVKLKIGPSVYSSANGNVHAGFSITLDDDASGKTVEEERTVEPFDKIKVENGIAVIFTQDPTQHLTVKADSSIIALIETKVENGRLMVRTTRPLRSKHTIAEVSVSAPGIVELDMQSGSQFRTTNQITGQSIDIGTSSGAITNMTAQYDQIDIDNSSGAITTVIGKCSNLNTDSSSGSIIDCHELVAENATVGSSSGAITKVNVTGNISVDASSGSVIECSGNPKNVDKNLSSGAVFSDND